VLIERLVTKWRRIGSVPVPYEEGSVRTCAEVYLRGTQTTMECHQSWPERPGDAGPGPLAHPMMSTIVRTSGAVVVSKEAAQLISIIRQLSLTLTKKVDRPRDRGPPLAQGPVVRRLPHIHVAATCVPGQGR